MTLRLNLGAGNQPRPGHLQVDHFRGEHVDVVCDLAHFPYPFGADTVDSIWMFHVLEHLPDTPGVLEELHRILVPGGTADIFVPYYNSVGAYTDPTHVCFFTLQTLDYFEAGSDYAYYSKARFEIERRELRCYRWARWIPNLPLRSSRRTVRGLRDILSTFVPNLGFDIHFRIRKPK